MERLLTAPWPGNIRQLAPFAVARDRFEADYLSNLLQVTNGNVTQAARLAERNRSEFYKLLKKHSLDPAAFRQHEGKSD